MTHPLRSLRGPRLARGSVVARLGVVAALLAAPASAQDPAPKPEPTPGTTGPAPAAPPAPLPPRAAAAGTVRIELESLDGTVRLREAELGPLTALSAEGAALVRFTGRTGLVPASLDPTAVAQVELANGDAVAGLVRAGEDDTLAIDLGGAVLAVELDELRSLVFRGRLPRDAAALPAAAREQDVLYFVAGRGLDRAEGLVEGVDATGIAFEDSRVGRRDYEWARVAALFVAPLDGPSGGDGGEGSRAAAGLDPVVVGLVGGGRLSGHLRSLDALHVRLERAPGAVLELPTELVVEVALADGSFIFLSDLPVADGGPLSPFGDDLGYTWPHRVDRAVDGGPLTVLGKVEPRGIGVHAPSRLTWRLDGEYAQLRVAVAVDDAGVGSERSGSVRFRVLGDGQELWRSAVVRGGQGATAAPPLALAGVRELVLEVDPDGDFVLDRADWLRPVLVRDVR